MKTSAIRKVRPALLGAAAAALVLTTTTALAGSGVGGVFNLGQVNAVDEQTSLNGNPGGNPLLKVTSTGTAAAVRGVAVNGIGTNGVSTSGVGQQGLSDTGIGTLGTHGDRTGISPGVQGETNSADPAGAGVVGKNRGGGPGLRAVVNAGAPPLAVNSNVKVVNLNADLLDGLDSGALQNRVSGTCAAGSAIKVVNANGTVACEPVGGGGAWSLAGNSGTTPGTNFLGTTDNQALELKVNGQRALRLEPTFLSPNVIAGFAGNSVGAGAVGATIAGGGDPGAENSSTSFGSIGGGAGNTVSDFGTVAGGARNTASSDAFVAGGEFNTASGIFSTIAGGNSNTASGVLSFAAGQQAKATEAGSFVWADSNTYDISSNGMNTFTARTTGGARFISAIDAATGAPTAGVTLAAGGGSWSSLSDRNAKQGFTAVDKQTLLRRLAGVPIERWSYKAQGSSIVHMGPTAQDFSRAFGLGEDNRHITTIDADGVALAAIQGLYRQNKALQHENRTLRTQLGAQNTRLTKLEQAFSTLSR